MQFSVGCSAQDYTIAVISGPPAAWSPEPRDFPLQALEKSFANDLVE